MKRMNENRLSVWVLRILCLALIIALTAGPALAAGKQTGDSYVVKASRLNLRSGPGTGYSIITRLKKGTVVTYRGTKNGWWYVDYDKGSGYVDGKYLSPMSAGTGTTSDEQANSLYATTCNLRVRSKASIEGAVLGKLKKGTRVTVLSHQGSWSRINYKGKTGWVASKYLKKAK